MNQEQVFSKVFDLLNKFEELITIEIKSINSFIIDVKIPLFRYLAKS